MERYKAMQTSTVQNLRVDPDVLWEFVEKELEALERKIRSLKPEKEPGWEDRLHSGTAGPRTPNDKNSPRGRAARRMWAALRPVGGGGAATLPTLPSLSPSEPTESGLQAEEEAEVAGTEAQIAGVHIEIGGPLPVRREAQDVSELSELPVVTRRGRGGFR